MKNSDLLHETYSALSANKARSGLTMLGIIIGIVFLYPIFGIYGLAYGVVLGAIMHLVIQLPFVFRSGYFCLDCIKIDWKEIRKTVAISIPRTIIGILPPRCGGPRGQPRQFSALKRVPTRGKPVSIRFLRWFPTHSLGNREHQAPKRRQAFRK